MTLAPLEEVRDFVLSRVAPAGPVAVPVADALGLALAEDVVAAEPVPPFPNSAMDGYAVRAADCATATPESPVELAVVGEVPAGAVPDRAVGPGEAVRIMTGAAVPEGADGIVIVEHTELRGDAVVVVVHHPAGDHVRPAGGDVAVGDLVFAAGTELGPAHLGVLASLGVAAVPARPRPRVGVLSTGDELVPPGAPLPPGKIRESNRPMLLALAERASCTAVDLGTVADDEDALAAALEDGIARCDALVTTGGVSMGEYDLVKVVLDRVADMRWFQVAIKPAKPFAFGMATPERRGAEHTAVPVFGLPGNPVSSFVSFEMFARPALRRMMGHAEILRPVVQAVAGAGMRRRRDGKTHLDRVRLRHEDGRLVAERSGAQASNVLTAMAHANGLAVLPDGEGVAAGEALEVMLLDPPPTLGS